MSLSHMDELMAEGLTEGEARYFTSGGSDDSGLEYLVEDPGGPANAEPPAPARSEREAAPQQLAERDAELRGLREQNVRLDERMRLFHEAMTAQQPQRAPQKPDRDSDPFGYMAYQDEQIEGLRSRFDQFTERAEAQAAAAELVTTFRGDAANYVRSNPDFWESAPNARDGAYHFLMQSRDAELQAAGYTNPQDRRRIIEADERDLVSRALYARQQDPRAPGPSEVLFNLARARGFTGRGQGQGQGQGQSARRGAPPAQQGGFDVARIAALTDSQYAAWKRSLSPQQRNSYNAALGRA